MACWRAYRRRSEVCLFIITSVTFLARSMQISQKSYILVEPELDFWPHAALRSVPGGRTVSWGTEECRSSGKEPQKNDVFDPTKLNRDSYNGALRSSARTLLQHLSVLRDPIPHIFPLRMHSSLNTWTLLFLGITIANIAFVGWRMRAPAESQLEKASSYSTFA